MPENAFDLHRTFQNSATAPIAGDLQDARAAPANHFHESGAQMAPRCPKKHLPLTSETEQLAHKLIIMRELSGEARALSSAAELPRATDAGQTRASPTRSAGHDLRSAEHRVQGRRDARGNRITFSRSCSSLSAKLCSTARTFRAERSHPEPASALCTKASCSPASANTGITAAPSVASAQRRALKLKARSMPLLRGEFIEPEPEAFHDLKHEMSECQL